MNISKHEHAACTEAPDLQQPNTFCSTEIQQDLGDSSACRGAQPCLVRERGGGTRGGAERGWKQTRPPAGRRCAMAHAAACAVVLLGKTGLRRRAGGRKPAGRVVFIAPQTAAWGGGGGGEGGRRDKWNSLQAETCGCGVRRRCVRVGGAGDSTGIPSAWNLDACVAARATTTGLFG